jgi:hypothetical protein
MFDTVCPDLNDTIKPCTFYIKGGHCSKDNHFRCTEYIRTHEPSMSYSMLVDYTQCHRKAFHGWIEGRQLIEPSWPLRLGSLASRILGMLHDEAQAETAVQAYQELINTEISSTIDQEDPENVGNMSLWAMKVLFDAYIAHDVHIQKGIPEYEFRWTLPEYPKLHGFIDLVMVNQNRGWEFKYTSSPDYYNLFTMHDQLAAYFIGLPSLQSFRTCLLVAPVMKFKKGETITQLYERNLEQVTKAFFHHHYITDTYYRSEFNLTEYADKAKMVAEEIQRYIQLAASGTHSLEYYFYQNRRSCSYPRCDFYDICSTGGVPENLYKKREIR